jgi:glutathione peroxidase-family protein
MCNQVTGLRAQGTNAYNYTVTTLTGQQYSLSRFAGKKILVAVVPVTHTITDSAFLDTLNILAQRYSDSIAVIGIPSYEDGYTDYSLYSLAAYYDSLTKAPLIMARGMYTRKTNVRQNPLFSWLTNYSKNNHFNEDVTGPRELYFIDYTGSLYAVISPAQILNDALMQQMLNQQPHG